MTVKTKRNITIALIIALAVLIIALAIVFIVRERNGAHDGVTPSPSGSTSSGTGGGTSGGSGGIGDNEFNIGDLLG